MCRSSSEGGRRCPGCASREGLDAHNTRRRENREILGEIVGLAEARGYGRQVVAELAAGGPAAAKAWARDHGLPDRLHPGQGHSPAHDADTGAGGWEDEEWAQDVVLADQVRRALDDQGARLGEAELLEGAVVDVEDHSEGINETRRVVLDTGAAGYHKPFTGLDESVAGGFGQEGPLQPLHEVAAWRLAHGMGEPWAAMVPPCVLREVNGELGSFGAHRPGLPSEQFQLAETWSAGAFFDALVGQQDRNLSNLLLDDEHERLYLIDHGFCFATEGDELGMSALLRTRLRVGNTALRTRELEALDRLVSSASFHGLAQVLDRDRLESIRWRARRMRYTGRVLDPGDY